MSFPVVYKQSFKPRGGESTPGLNVAHLQYISTRPGVVKNPACGFGLWGKLPGDSAPKHQTDLERAKELIRQASETRTIYRGLVSVGREDAEQYDLYNRKNWERLVGDHVQDIARQMDIQPENLRWAASMHMKKNHPHVHLLFWDGGKDPRPEFIPKPQFEAKVEAIRAAFAGDIHRAEIRQLQREQRELSKDLRGVLQAMAREANPVKGLNLDELEKSPQLAELAKSLEKLLASMPQRGSLRFQYLPPAYKAQVMAAARQCLEIPELAKELQRYENATREISRLYANGEKSTEAAVSKARDKLERELANQVMDALRELSAELQRDAPETAGEARDFARQAAREIVPGLPSYPKLRMILSVGSGGGPEVRDLERAVMKEAMSDNRILLRLRGYAIHAAGLKLDMLPKAEVKSMPGGAGSPHTLCGRILTDQQWERYDELYWEAKRRLQEEIRAVCGLESAEMSSELWNERQKNNLYLVKEILPSLPEYRALSALLPRQRIPAWKMDQQIPGFREAMNQVMKALMSDSRIRFHLQTTALGQSVTDPGSLPDAVDGTESGHTVFGKALSDEQWERYQEEYRKEKRNLREYVATLAGVDAGWQEEQFQTSAAGLVCDALRILSQLTGQQGQMSRSKYRSRDKSREQRRDERAGLSSGDTWWHER